jgi:hypothetical protein
MRLSYTLKNYIKFWERQVKNRAPGMVEFRDRYRKRADQGLLDWQKNPRAGLPVWLTVAAQKPG